MVTLHVYGMVLHCDTIESARAQARNIADEDDTGVTIKVDGYTLAVVEPWPEQCEACGERRTLCPCVNPWGLAPPDIEEVW